MPSSRSKELTSNLLSQQIVDISREFPATSPEEYMDLANALFHAGVFRIPIVGIRTVDQITSLALISSGVQEHRELAKLSKLDISQIVYTASLEGYPFSDFDPFYAYLKLNLTNHLAYQRMGRGSDYFPAQLSQEGVDELSRIFKNIGTLINA